MKRLKSLEIVNAKSGSEYCATLFDGDLMIAFFHESMGSFGSFFKRADVTDFELNKVYNEAKNVYGLEIKNVEIKVITSSRNVKIIESCLSKKPLKKLKISEKSGQFDIQYFPAAGKLRVSIDQVKNIIEVSKKIKVLIVDDSKTIRTILSKIFSSDPSLIVCAMAEKPSDVEKLILEHNPDVITLDIHMPEMDGVTLLKTIITPKFQIPTVMISSISMVEGPLVLEALENGAVDYIQKPEMSEIEKVTPLILEKVKTAALSNQIKKMKMSRPQVVQTNEKANFDSLIVLGSSTGGTEAIREILTAFPKEIPPMLIVQHIPAVFSLAFAKRMNELCSFEVKEAEDGDEVKKNRVLIAPGGKQMKLVTRAGKAFVEINDDAPVNRFKPSVDYMFFSVAKCLYTHVVGVILTGMGKDGAKGMLELYNNGVRTIAQDEESSVVFGMPKEAIALGAAEFVVPLNGIAEKIIIMTNQKKLKKEVS